MGAAKEAEPWSGQGGPLRPFGPLDEQALGPGTRLRLRPGAGVAHGKGHAGQQGQGASVAASAVRVLSMGLTGVVGGVNLRRDIGRAGVQGRTGFVRTRRARGCAGPLQGQAEHQQQGKQAGTHQGWIVG